MFGKKIKGICIISIFLLLSAASALSVTGLTVQKITKSFYPSDDSTISKGDPNYNFNLEKDGLVVRNMYGDSGSDYWAADALIKFDSLLVPKNSMVLSATLYVFYYKTLDASPAGRILNLYRITSNWNEESVTWNTQPSYATVISSSSIVPQAPGVWMKFDVTKDVQKIADGIYSNYGWKITDETFWGLSDIPMIYFFSKEFSYNVPYLKVVVSNFSQGDIDKVTPITNVNNTCINTTKIP